MSTQFTITAASSTTSHIINNGMSLIETDAIISIISYTGYLNLYVYYCDKSYQYPNENTANNQLSINSEDSTKSESITVDITSQQPIYIGVEPVNVDSDSTTAEITYSIVVTQNSMDILTDGTSIKSTLKKMITKNYLDLQLIKIQYQQ